MEQENTQRKCIVSGEVLDKDKLLRFVVGPEATVIPDFKKRLPGRGVYVANSRAVLRKAIAGNLFAKSLKQKVRPAEGLESMVEHLLRQSALQIVSLARKAGDFVCGMDKVAEALQKGKVAFLLEATDAGADGHEKIAHLAQKIEIFELFTTEELDQALDKINTVHAAFLKGEMSKKVSHEFRKLADFLNS